MLSEKKIEMGRKFFRKHENDNLLRQSEEQSVEEYVPRNDSVDTVAFLTLYSVLPHNYQYHESHLYTPYLC